MDGEQSHGVQGPSPARFVQACLDAFHSLRRRVVNCVTYIALRLFGLEVDYRFVRCGTYDTRKHEDLRLENAQDVGMLLGTAKDLWNEARDRRTVITDKTKTLLTLSTLLLGLVSVLLPKSLTFDSISQSTFFLVAVVSLLSAVTMLLVFFDVGTETGISLDQDEVALSQADLQKNHINLYLRCQTALENRTDYLVDVYKAARFFTLTGFTIVVTLFAVNFLSRSQNDASTKIVQELRSDPALIDLLRGPKGVKGEDGSRGDRGATGDAGSRGETGTKGEKGDRGQDAILDEAKLVDQILESPRLRELIDNAVKATPTEPSQVQPSSR